METKEVVSINKMVFMKCILLFTAILSTHGQNPGGTAGGRSPSVSPSLTPQRPRPPYLTLTQSTSPVATVSPTAAYPSNTNTYTVSTSQSGRATSSGSGSASASGSGSRMAPTPTPISTAASSTSGTLSATPSGSCTVSQSATPSANTVVGGLSGNSASPSSPRDVVPASTIAGAAVAISLIAIGSVAIYVLMRHGNGRQKNVATRKVPEVRTTNPAFPIVRAVEVKDIEMHERIGFKPIKTSRSFSV